MRNLIVSVAILFLAAGPAVNAADNGLIKGAELREAVAGRTFYLATPLGEVPIRYSSNGTMTSTTQLALLDGEKTTSDRGRWWVRNNQLCLKWQNWMKARSYCFALQKRGGNRVYWTRSDGKTGTARIGS